MHATIITATPPAPHAPKNLQLSQPQSLPLTTARNQKSKKKKQKAIKFKKGHRAKSTHSKLCHI